MSDLYHIDPNKLTLTRFLKSLKSRNLIPSRQPLKENIDEAFDKIQSEGVKNLGDLIHILNSRSKIGNLAERTGIPVQYLTLLRREACSYLPNPVSLGSFSGFEKANIHNLAESGIKHSKQLLDRIQSAQDRQQLCFESNVPESILNELIHLSDLSRLYGVGPAFARLLYDIGIDSVRKFLSRTPEDLVELYENKMQRKADFSVRDIQFSQEIGRELQFILDGSE